MRPYELLAISPNPVNWFEIRLVITVFIQVSIKVGIDTGIFGFITLYKLSKSFSIVVYDEKYIPKPFEPVGYLNDKTGELSLHRRTKVFCESREVNADGETM